MSRTAEAVKRALEARGIEFFDNPPGAGLRELPVSRDIFAGRLFATERLISLTNYRSVGSQGQLQGFHDGHHFYCPTER